MLNASIFLQDVFKNRINLLFVETLAFQERNEVSVFENVESRKGFLFENDASERLDARGRVSHDD